MRSKLVGLEAGQAAGLNGARNYLDSLILEEIEDDLREQCGVDARHDPQETWLDTVKQRLRDHLDSFRAGVEDRHGEIEAPGSRRSLTLLAVNGPAAHAGAISRSIARTYRAATRTFLREPRARDRLASR